MAGKAHRWSAPKWIALGVASLVLVGAAVFFVRAAATGDYDENSLMGKILANSDSAEHKKGSDGDGGTNVSLLSSTQEVPADADSAAATPAPGKATPTVEPTATPTNAQKKEEASKQTSAPSVTATPKQATTAAPTAAPTATPTVKPTATPNTATAWSDWVTKLPAGISSPIYSIESKQQYRYVYYIKISDDTYYQYDYGDGNYSDWTMDGSLCGTYSYSTKQVPSYSPPTYGDWKDGSPRNTYWEDDLGYGQAETRTVYRYKHN